MNNSVLKVLVSGLFFGVLGQSDGYAQSPGERVLSCELSAGPTAQMGFQLVVNDSGSLDVQRSVERSRGAARHAGRDGLVVSAGEGRYEAEFTTSGGYDSETRRYYNSISVVLTKESFFSGRSVVFMGHFDPVSHVWIVRLPDLGVGMSHFNVVCES